MPEATIFQLTFKDWSPISVTIPPEAVRAALYAQAIDVAHNVARNVREPEIAADLAISPAATPGADNPATAKPSKSACSTRTLVRLSAYMLGIV
jgi:hypothetical protein